MLICNSVAWVVVHAKYNRNYSVLRVIEYGLIAALKHDEISEYFILIKIFFF
jgi:hypothetical protein